jgi:hypothetical protein
MERNLTDREDFKEILDEINKSRGYWLGITILNDDGNLKHYLVSNNFPKLDFLRSNKKIKELIIDDLEKDEGDMGVFNGLLGR